MIVNLKSGALMGLADGAPPEAENCVSIERPALLVYAGDFISVAGPVKVTEAMIGRLVENHNALMARAARLVAGQVPLKNCPPLQLDHSTSARDTVGRLVGPLTLGIHVNDDGETVPAIYGTLRFLGKENVERVQDGRWTHLSVGADFETGKFSELTITPFPAAGDASLLKAARLSDENTETNSPPAKETTMEVDKAKLKKYLTGSKKMSDSDADMELSKADEAMLKKLSAECDEDEKRLSAESAEAEKKEKEEKEAQLTAKRAKLVQLSTDFRAQVTAAQLAAKSGRILTRLSKLRADAKITPAEIKKMDIAKLAASDDASIALVLKSYEDREPVIFVGQLGTTKAADLANLGGDAKARVSQLEAETRANMSLLAKSSAPLSSSDLGSGTPHVVSVPAGPTAEDAAIAAKEHTELCALLDKGDVAGTKVRLKAWLQRTSALSSVAEYTESAAAETEAQLDSLVKGIEKLQTGFNDLTKLAGEIAGITI